VAQPLRLPLVVKSKKPDGVAHAGLSAEIVANEADARRRTFVAEITFDWRAAWAITFPLRISG
jgi:hypothetical protein